MTFQFSRRSVAVLAAAVGAFGAVQSHAAEWVVGARSNDGVAFEVDADSLARTGALVKSWMRQNYQQPQRAANGKQYVTSLTVRFDDCDGRRYQLGEYFEKNRGGDVVASGTLNGGWSTVVPGTIGDGFQQTVCALTKPPAEKPLLDDISAGTWDSLGDSGDKTFALSVKMDSVVKLEENNVVVFTRSDYRTPTPIGGLFVDHVVSANLIDCQNAKIAYFGADHYIGSRRVASTRTPESQFRFETMAPRSFALASYQRTCAMAQPVPTGNAPQRADRTVGSGTGWAVAKGYVVTASHVVSGGSQILVYSNGEKVGTATLIAKDEANDLAVLKVSLVPEAGPLIALPLSDRPASLGRSVFTLGYPAPGVLGQRIKMTAGEVSSTTGIQDDVRQIQISIPIQQGNSGGPIIGWDGSVIGVVESKLTRFDEEGSAPRPENVNYAVKVAYLRPLLDELPDLKNYGLVKPSGDVDELVSQARKAVFMLVVQ